MGGKRKQQLEKYGAIFVDNPMVTDENYITSTAPGTALEVAFKLLGKLTNEANVEIVRSKMRISNPSIDWYHAQQV